MMLVGLFTALAYNYARKRVLDRNENHQAWIIWAAVDTLLPLLLGTTGCHIMRETF